MLSGCLQGPPGHFQEKSQLSTSCPHTLNSAIPQGSNAFEIGGRISLSDGKRHQHLSMRWQQRDDHYQLDLYGPLGTAAIHLNGYLHGPLNAPGKNRGIDYQDAQGSRRHYDSPEHLAEDTLGIVLPLSGIPFWIQGQMKPELKPEGKPGMQRLDKAHSLSLVRNAVGCITELHQDGWIIVYGAYQVDRGVLRPRRIQLKQGVVRINILIQQWRGLA